jgi:hypothetical protein
MYNAFYLGVALTLLGCQAHETKPLDASDAKRPCNLDSAFFNGVTIDYPNLSDSSFTLRIADQNRQDCRPFPALPCLIPRVSVPRFVIMDEALLFFESGSGNYDRHLLTVSLQSCAVLHEMEQFLELDTIHNIVALFVRTPEHKGSLIKLVSYDAIEIARIELEEVQCAVPLACLDSAWFTADHFIFSYHDDPNQPSRIREFALP